MHPTATAPSPKNFTSRAGSLEGYVPLLTELGIDGLSLLDQAGIDPEDLVDPNRLIPYKAFLQAMRLARDISEIQHFGLLLAERQAISMFGPLGFAIAEAPTVGAALEELNRYLHLHNDGSIARLELDGELAMWRYESKLPGAVGNAQQEDLAVGIGRNVMRHLCRRDWAPELVTLQRRAPINSVPWRRYFQCPVEFEAEHNQLIFPRSDLAGRIGQANSRLHAIMGSHLKHLDASDRQDFGAEVQAIILHAMKNGDCTLPRVAKMLGTSTRTLQRRLTEEGRSFRRELDSVRVRVAIRYLEETSIPLASLALMLDYADTTAFSHAFRRLTGASPARWRAHRHCEDN